MPNDNEVVPDVSMGCSVPEEPRGDLIVNLIHPDIPPGTGMTYVAGPPSFVGVMPMRQDLTILHSPEDSVFPETPTDMSRVRFEPVSEVGQDGQVLVATSSGSQWGPAPPFDDDDLDHLQVDPNGGMVLINQSSPMSQGDIRFHMPGGLEVLRIEANGDFYVHGRKVDNDHEIYQNFRKFLGMSYNLPVPDPRPRDGIETRYERIIKKLDGDQ